MARHGHSSVRAALIYRHATRDRDQAIAEALGMIIRQVLPEEGTGPADGSERGERKA
jgi:hypothetical protein